MDRTVLTESRSPQRTVILWLIGLLIVAAVIGLTWMLAQNGPATLAADEAAPEPALAGSEGATESLVLTGPRAADAFSAQLDVLRRRAVSVASRDGASAHGVSLEALAQVGRQAYLENRAPTTADGYAIYLDSLRRQGQAARDAGTAGADANAFSQWLDQLRRLSQ